MLNAFDVVVSMFAGLGASNIIVGFLQRFQPKPPPKKWRVHLDSPSGFPARQYLLTEEQICKVMAMIHKELDQTEIRDAS